MTTVKSEIIDDTLSTLIVTNNLGIGATTLSRRLTIQNPTTTSTNNQLLYLKQQPNDYGYSFNIDDNSTGNLFIKAVNNGTESDLLTLDRSNKRVGIATATPANIFSIAGSSATPSLRFESAAAPLYFWDIGRDNATTGDFIFTTASGGASSERMRIRKEGQVLIGTATQVTSALLEMSGTAGVAVISQTAASNATHSTTINTVNTTDATVTTIHTITLATDTQYTINGSVRARRTGGSAGTTGDGAGYSFFAVVKNISGVASLVSTADIVSKEDQAGWDFTITATGSTILARVTGAVNNNITWDLFLEQFGR